MGIDYRAFTSDDPYVVRSALVVAASAPFVGVEAEVKRRAAIISAASADPVARRWLWEQSAQSYRFWHDNFVWVMDPIASMLDGMPAKRPASSEWDFHEELSSLWLTRYNILMEKSREVGASVEACECATWTWLFRPSSHQIFVSLKRDKVDDNTQNYNRSLFGKIRRIVRWLPPWMRPSTWREKRRARFHDRHMILTNPDNGAEITGQSTSADALRGERGVRVYIDEANSIPWLSELLEAAQRVGPVCMTSSVKGRGRHFARMAHGDVVPITPYGDLS